MSYLKKQTEVPWEALQLQFGAGYAVDPQGTRDFKKKFLKHLRTVQLVYPGAKVTEGSYGLLLQPSKPHIARLPLA